MRKNSGVDKYIERATAETGALLSELRGIILKAVPDTEENIKWGMPVYSIKKNFCFLHSSKKHVTLGFYGGSKLTDKDGLLEGTGKQMRHIKVRNKKDIRKQQFTRWIKAAAEQS